MNNKVLDNRNSPLVSVIVPIYNVEDYLPRCLDSILTQTYENLEIILVNDGSTDSSDRIIDTYLKQDERIVKVEHQGNRGLFQARLSGVDYAHGEYVAFVDSDDYISVDWVRVLVNKAEESGSDIVVGEWCFDHDGESITYINLDPFRLQDYELRKQEVLNAFMEQEGLCFSWTVVWNKLYRKSLWSKCEEDYHSFSREHGHMLMWEDIAFSSALWTRAELVSNVHGINYFYFKHSSASTAVSKDLKRNQKYIHDASCAMKFFKTQLEKTGNYTRVRKNYISWNKHAASILYNELVISLGKSSYEKMIRDAFEFTEEFSEQNHFFYHVSTLLDDSFRLYENCKRKICAPEIKYVSFDVFDTLINRPFLDPDGIFHLLNDWLNSGNSAYVDYYSIRKNAENISREKKRLETPSCEEITIDEIYEEIQRSTVLTPEQIQAAKTKEIELEISLCKARRIGKELFELALFAGKKIIICTDMYLPHKVLEEILIKNGYDGWDGLYLSSDLKKTKSSGKLFSHVLRDLEIKNPKQILHIGDNLSSDVKSPERLGILSIHLDRSESIFRNSNQSIYGGEFYKRTYTENNRDEDYLLALSGYPATNWLLALVANRFFDNPFVSFNRESDFNSDPCYVGYAALGPHLLALAQWIEEKATELHVPTVHFVARDGYMVKQVFDIVNTSKVRSNYIRLSRKSLLLADVDMPSDLYSMLNKVNVINYSAEKLMECLAPIIPKERECSIHQIFDRHQIEMTSLFANENEFLRCLKIYIEDIIDFALLKKYKEKLRDYFSEFIKPGDYIFDIGYSGRPEAALSNILGFPVGSFYIHENSEIAFKRRKKYSALNECFYQYKPKITGVIREHLLMELGPSTVGYIETEGKLYPLFENYEENYCVSLMTRLVQDNAIRFIEDYYRTFGKYIDSMIFPRAFLSAGIEYYLHYSKPIDHEFLAPLVFEDSIGAGELIKALDFWNNEIMTHVLTSSESSKNSIPEEGAIYVGGFYAKLYGLLNKWFPVGSLRREYIRRLSSILIRH